MENFITRSKIVSSIACALLVSACTSITPPTVDFDRNAKVETVGYKTFTLLNETKTLSESTDINPTSKVKFDDAISIAFEKQGYQLVSDPTKADFTVVYSVSGRDKVKVRPRPVKFKTYTKSSQAISSEGEYLAHPVYSSLGKSSVNQYGERSLAIDVIDVKTHQTAWSGYTTKRIYAKDEKNKDQIIKDTVNIIVAQFQ